MNFDIDNENLKGKKIYRILLCIFAGIILIAAVYTSLRRTAARFSRDFMSPFLRIVTVTENNTYLAAQLAKPKRQLASEVQILQNRVLLLESKNHVLKNLESENRVLRALLKLPQTPGFQPVTAEISGRTAPLWRERFVINRGWSDGLNVGNAVATPDHSGNIVLVGRIIEISAGSAVVATVFSGDCRLSVVVETDTSAGGMEVLKEKDLPVVRYLPIGGDYQDNARVLTSGIADDTPAGIPVGTVLSRGKDQPPAIIRDQLYAELSIRPMVNIDTVRTVIVFTKKSEASQ